MIFEILAAVFFVCIPYVYILKKILILIKVARIIEKREKEACRHMENPSQCVSCGEKTDKKCGFYIFEENKCNMPLCFYCAHDKDGTHYKKFHDIKEKYTKNKEEGGC